MANMKVKTIKSVENNRFELKLVQSNSSGLYYVASQVKQEDDNNHQITEGMQDFKIASFVFDEYLVRLEGN